MSYLTVYKASAGSGKTFTLAAEYIARLLNGEPGMYRHILAVTFTNKATTEMKERILQRLWDLSTMSSDSPAQGNDFLAKVMELLPGVTPEEIRKRAAISLRNLTHDYDHFHVETIDSFFQTLLSNLAHELGLSAGLKVDLDDQEAINKGVDRLMSTLTDKPAVMEWVLNYIKERIDENQKWDITAEVKSLGKELMKEQFMCHDGELRHLLDDSQFLGSYRGKLKQIKENALEQLAQKAQAMHDAIEAEGNGYQDFSRGKIILYPFLQRIIKGILTPPSDALLKWIDNTDVWLKKADLNQAAKVARAEKTREMLGALETQRAQLSIIVNSCNLSLRHLNPLRLLNEIGREVNNIQQENNHFMLAKTPYLFDRLVEEEDAPFVFEKAGTTFQHVMIDEFQDTSTLQWKNFKKLLVENMASGNKCLLVGDVKQSIYRFRGGDWSILNHIESHFRNGRPDIKHLEQNFRSSENVIHFNNSFFPIAAQFLDEQGLSGNIIQNIYSDVRQEINHRANGQVRIQLYDQHNAEDEDEPADEPCMEEDLARQILLLHEQGVQYSQMAILVRFNSSASHILAHFAEHFPDIPLISDEAFLLSASPAVQLIIHALRWLNDENDAIAAAHVTRYWSALQNGTAPGWQELCGLHDITGSNFLSQEARNGMRAMPLYELCEYLIRLFQLHAVKGAAPYLFTLLDQTLTFLEDHPADIGQFLRYWEESLYKKAVPSGEMDGVRILTIHKSKGLAFHTVLLPYCDWNMEKDRKEDILWCEPSEPPYNQLPLLPIPLVSGKTIMESIYATDYQVEHLQRRIENLNLLYVAFTRAQQNLYIWATAKAELKGEITIGDLLRQTLLRMHQDENLQETGQEDVWQYQVRESKATAPHKVVTEHDNPLEFKFTTEIVNLTSYESRVEFLQSNNARQFCTPDEENAEQQESYISQGKLLHHLFANIHTRDDIEPTVQNFMQQGLITDQRQSDQMLALIKRRIEHPTVRKWFDGSARLFNECTILSRDEHGHLLSQRPDRVMVKGNTATVVDFKFGKKQQKYRDQVERYKQLLRQMGYAPVVGYLWYVYTGEVEEV